MMKKVSYILGTECTFLVINYEFVHSITSIWHSLELNELLNSTYKLGKINY